MKVTHTLDPIYNKESKVLILGSIPSIKSRELGFYYGHPKNKFWQTLATIYEEPLPKTIPEKTKFLTTHHIALFDVIKSCEITSSSDASIRNIVPNDLTPILKNANIKAIFTTGTKAHQLYQKHCLRKTNIPDINLPSTSPANCQRGIEEKLLQTYSKIKIYTNE